MRGKIMQQSLTKIHIGIHSLITKKYNWTHTQNTGASYVFQNHTYIVGALFTSYGSPLLVIDTFTSPKPAIDFTSPGLSNDS